MSTRERWIVYPLLFLTLGVALRDKIIPPARFGDMGTILKAGELNVKRIRCDELQAGRARFNQTETLQSECLKLLVIRPDGRPAIIAYADPNTRNGVIKTLSAAGIPLVMLQSTPAGGIVATLNSSGRLSDIMGSSGAHLKKRSPPPPSPTAQPTEKENTERPADKRDQ